MRFFIRHGPGVAASWVSARVAGMGFCGRGPIAALVGLLEFAVLWNEFLMK